MSKRAMVRQLVACFLVFVCITPLSGTCLGSELPETEVLIVLQFDESGRAFVATVRNNLSSFENTIGILRSQRVRSELAIENSQLQELDEIVEWLEKRSTEIKNQKLANNGVEADADYAASCEELRQKLNACLLPFQSKRLKQITNQLALQKSGIRGAFETIARNNEIELTDSELSAISELLHTERERSLATVDQVKEDLWSSVIDSLSAKTRGAISDHFGSDWINAPAEVCLIELEKLLSETAPQDRVGKGSSIEESVRDLITYKLRPDGTWESVQLYARVSDSGIYVVLANYVRQPSIAELLQITDQQGVTIAMLVKDMYAKLQIARADFRAMEKLAAENKGLVEGSASEIHVQQVREIQEEFAQSFKTVITNDQLSQLKRWITRHSLKRGALVQQLGRGNVGDEVELTDADLRSLKKACQTELERAKRRLAVEQERLLSAVYSTLPVDKRRAMQALLGEPSDHYSPSIFLLLTELLPGERRFMDDSAR